MKKYFFISIAQLAAVALPSLALAETLSETGKAIAGLHDQIVFLQFLTLVSVVLAIGGMTAGVGAMLGFWASRRK